MVISRPIRTLHLINGMDRRGAEICAATLTDRLSRERFTPAIWPVLPVPPYPGLVPEHTHVFGRHGTDRRGGAAALVHLFRVVRAHRPDVVHCHGGRALKFALSSKPVWRAQAYVYTKIGSLYPWLDSAIRRNLYGHLFEQLDAIITVGDGLRRELLQAFHLRRPRIVTIRTGVDERAFSALAPGIRDQIRAEMGVCPGEICVISIGSLTWEKDPLEIIRIVARGLTAHRNVRIVFVGDGPLAAQVRESSAVVGISDRVSLLGVRSDVPRLLSAADVIVLTSHTEGVPGALIEAGMAGIPAVAYGVGSVDEVLRDGVSGWIIPPRNAGLFALRLQSLIASPAVRAQMGAAARAHVRARFGIEDFVHSHELLFTDLVREGSRKVRRDEDLVVPAPLVEHK